MRAALLIAAAFVVALSPAAHGCEMHKLQSDRGSELYSQLKAQRIALLMGNSAYESAPLRGVLQDVRTLARALNGIGFTTYIYTNCNLQEMNSAASDFAQRVTPGATVFFFYSGHGVQIDSQIYLIPLQAGIENQQFNDEIKKRTLPLERIYDLFKRDELSARIFLIDACRDVTTFVGSRPGPTAPGPDRALVAYSTQAGRPASDTSSYIRDLAAAIAPSRLQEGKDTLSSILDELRQQAERSGTTGQIPEVDDKLGCDLYLKPLTQSRDMPRPSCEDAQPGGGGAGSVGSGGGSGVGGGAQPATPSRGLLFAGAIALPLGVIALASGGALLGVAQSNANQIAALPTSAGWTTGWRAEERNAALLGDIAPPLLIAGGVVVGTGVSLLITWGVQRARLRATEDGLRGQVGSRLARAGGL